MQLLSELHSLAARGPKSRPHSGVRQQACFGWQSCGPVHRAGNGEHSELPRKQLGTTNARSPQKCLFSARVVA